MSDPDQALHRMSDSELLLHIGIGGFVPPRMRLRAARLLADLRSERIGSTFGLKRTGDAIARLSEREAEIVRSLASPDTSPIPLASRRPTPASATPPARAGVGVPAAG